MTFDAMWEEVIEKNKQLNGGGSVTMSPVAFKKAMRYAYDRGYKHSDAGADILGGLFR